ncbi:hypothetical protein PYW07_000007 [Mythimna separata]|uniref:Uncharacterized protein n=1 Tax=Mythimna separata TaxID=271217 RepID=A0AAD8E043_MYTSE|nr:hypothetical protein PYW07_000007 [Mythimna separata]
MYIIIFMLIERRQNILTLCKKEEHGSCEESGAAASLRGAVGCGPRRVTDRVFLPPIPTDSINTSTNLFEKNANHVMISNICYNESHTNTWWGTSRCVTNETEPTVRPTEVKHVAYSLLPTRECKL